MPRNQFQSGPDRRHYHDTLGLDETPIEDLGGFTPTEHDARDHTGVPGVGEGGGLSEGDHGAIDHTGIPGVGEGSADELTADELAAVQGAASPTALNPFATMADAGVQVLADPGNVWEAETVVAEGYRIAVGSAIFEIPAEGGGTTGVTEPDPWLFAGDEVSDGTAVWRCIGSIGELPIAYTTSYVNAAIEQFVPEYMAEALEGQTVPLTAPSVQNVIDALVAAFGLQVSGVGVGGDLRSVTVDLSAAQIITLDSVPVEIIPAPGANKAIVLVSAALQFVGGNVAFTTDPMALLTVGATGMTFGNPTPVGFDNADIETLTAGVLGADGVDMVNAEDQPAMFLAVGAPGGSGNGTARITVLYWVMDLIGPS